MSPSNSNQSALHIKQHSIVLKDNSKTAITEFARTDKPEQVLIVLPAMGVFATYYDALASALVGPTTTLFTADLRGNGLSEIRPKKGVDFGYQDILDLDYQGIIDDVNQTYPGVPVFLLGHSLGGQLACLYCSRFPEKVAGLILVACPSVYYKGWSGFGRWTILGFVKFAKLVSNLLGYFPGKKLGFGGTEAKTLIHDWNHQGLTGKYEPKGAPINYEQSLGKLTTPTLVISFESDKYAPRESVEHLYKKMASAGQIVHEHMQDTKTIKYSHFNWVKKNGEITKLIKNWIAGN